MLKPKPEDLEAARKRAELVDELRGVRCRCGGQKSAWKSFCWRCWVKLPHGVQSRLYLRIGKGYEEAHAEALRILEANG